DLNVSGTSYLGNITIEADNFTVNNIIPKGSGSVSVDGNLTANYFIGDGSGLSGISQGIWNNISGVATYEGDANVTGNLHVNGSLIGSSPLEVRDGIELTNESGDMLFRLYEARHGEYFSNAPVDFNNTFFIETENINNPYEIEICFYDNQDQTILVCIPENVNGKVFTVRGGLQIVGNNTLKANNGSFVDCEGNNYVDCINDLLVEDDIETKGNIYSQGNVNVDGNLYQLAYASDEDLVLHMPFDEDNGATQFDRGSYAYDGTQVGDVTCSVDVNYGKGCYFDGGSGYNANYIELGNSASSINFGNDFSVMMWVKTNASNVGLLYESTGDSTWSLHEKIFYLSATSAVPSFVGHSCQYIRGSSSVNDGEWHSIVFTWDDSESVGKVYVDGVDDTSSSDYTGCSDNGNVLRIGQGSGHATDGGKDFTGYMDEVRIFSRVLSEDEVRTAYLQSDGKGVVKVDNFRV
ncbi:MAG: LamG domain-containing protein, partial [Chlorobiales bacterium]|nr:LamG domain-containing protein [Chlorobiales bacterium]